MIGILPLMFFLAQVVHYLRIRAVGSPALDVQYRQPAFSDWFVFVHRRLMRIAIIWTIPGLFIWFLYVVLAWGVFFSSTLAMSVG